MNTDNWVKHGRKKPYMELGIGRLPCFRCGQKADQQWTICADNNLYRPVCSHSRGWGKAKV